MASTGVDSIPAPASHPPSNEDPSSRTSLKVLSEDDCYDMSGVRKAFILCITKGRDGAAVDLENLRVLLRDLGFQVTEHTNANGEDIVPLLEEYRDSIEASTCCSFVFILAHGKLGKVLGADKEEVDLQKIFNMFNNECQNLQLKPKVFVVQTCRGEEKDSGVLSGFRALPVKPEKLPTISDTFIVYPSRPGYVAYRDISRGSHLITFLTEVFQDFAEWDHLYDLFVKVNRKMVNQKFVQKGKETKTTLVLESTLTKHIYFKNPKPLEGC